MRNVLVLLCLIASVASYKFLAISPQFANSHVNFMGKITDVLIDAGHEVVMLSSIIDTSVGGPGTKKARVIEVPQCSTAKTNEEHANSEDSLIGGIWTDAGSASMLELWDQVMIGMMDQCNATLRHPGLLEKLRAEKFDAAYFEAIDYCGFGITALLGIEKYAVTQSLAIVDGESWPLAHVQFHPAYMPTMLSGSYGDDMTFWQRMENTLDYLFCIRYVEDTLSSFDAVFRGFDSSIARAHDIYGATSLVFLNTEPLTDFPRPTSHKIVEIGGIVVASGHQALDKKWSDIMDARPQTVLVSFGTFAKAYLMPETYKKTLRETIEKFPNVTFIVKYEKPEHGISRGIDNLIETTWMPQKDILNDARLSAFVTHCGQGSTTEANTAGVPLVVIPVTVDQMRNAYQIKRNGLGVVIEKSTLTTTDTLEVALREVLGNPKYTEKARTVARMIQKRPFAMKDIFVRNMEFLVEFGPLRQLDHHAAKLNFAQYFLLDILAFVVGCALVAVIFVVVLVRIAFQILRKLLRVKAKQT